MKSKRITALALISILTISALVPSALAANSDQGSSDTATVQEKEKSGRHARHGERSAVTEPDDAIGKDAAKEKALADAGFTAEQAGRVKARVARSDDGTVLYKVSFTCDGQRYSYQINAVTGAILDKSSEAAAERADRPGGRGRHGNRPVPTDEAVSAAA